MTTNQSAHGVSLYTRYADLQDKTVFISGGSSGIGAELVRAFYAQGCKVAFCGTKPGGATTLLATLTPTTLQQSTPIGTQPSHSLYPPYYEVCDVRDIAELEAMMLRIEAHFGPIQILINNAGRDDRHSLEELTPEYWDNCLALNLRHQVFATQIASRQMKRSGGGSIINMGSISWMRGRPNLIGYAASKAAIAGMTRSLARELGEFNIRVNAIAPGAIVTERQNALWRNAEEDQKFIDFQCLKFRLDSTHIAKPCLFLASQQSEGITGQNLLVDAGLAQVSVVG